MSSYGGNFLLFYNFIPFNNAINLLALQVESDIDNRKHTIKKLNKDQYQTGIILVKNYLQIRKARETQDIIQ